MLCSAAAGFQPASKMQCRDERLFETPPGGANAPASQRLLRMACCDAAAHGQVANCWAVSFSPDGNMLTVAADTCIGLLHVAASDVQATQPALLGHTRHVVALAFSASVTLASGSLDGTMRLWELPSGV